MGRLPEYPSVFTALGYTLRMPGVPRDANRILAELAEKDVSAVEDPILLGRDLARLMRDERVPRSAKLKLLESGTPPYQLVQLVQDPPLLADNQDPNNLRDIELDDAGNVYISNAYSLNESDRIWKYEPNGTVVKSLSLGNPGGASYIPNPIGLYVSNTSGMLYLASGQYNPADINSTVVYGLSLEDFSLKRSITVNDMQHVSGNTRI